MGKRKIVPLKQTERRNEEFCTRMGRSHIQFHHSSVSFDHAHKFAAGDNYRIVVRQLDHRGYYRWRCFSWLLHFFNGDVVCEQKVTIS